MTKVVAIMSMSLDGFVADVDDGVAEVFDWYFTSGDVELETGGADPMTFRVSEPSAEYLRARTSGLGAVSTAPTPSGSCSTPASWTRSASTSRRSSSAPGSGSSTTSPTRRSGSAPRQ